MKVLYFSATGNSLYVAKCFGGQMISIAKMLRNNTCHIEDPEAIGIVFPTYGHSVPEIVIEFIQQASLESPYIFVIMTAGGGVGDALSYLKKVAAKHNILISYANYVMMVNNHIPKTDLMEEGNTDKGETEKIRQIVLDIEQRKEYIFTGRKIEAVGRKAIAIVHAIHKDDCRNYSVSDGCVGCGTCASVCPRKNICCTSGKAVFGGVCEGCQSCVHACPKKAIQVPGDCHPDLRYRNRNIALKELMIDL